MDFEKILEEQFERMKLLKLHYKVCLDKEKHRKECKELEKVTAEVEKLLQDAHKVVGKLSTIKEEIEKDMYRAHRQKMLMMRIMEAIETEKNTRLEELSNTPEYALRERNFSTPGSSFRLHRLPRSVGRTPSSVMRGAKSPLGYRTSVNATDFEYTISSKLFEQIPRYLRGRDTLIDLQDFQETVITKTFMEKYRMLSKERNTIALRDRNIYDLFHNQENEFPNRLFITQGDISRTIGKMIDKRCSARIQMLRHIKILQEVRKKSTIYYFWLPNEIVE